MASYHLSVKSVRRSEGRSATAAAAYRHAERIPCEREGRVHDYRAKSGVEASFIVAPEDAPAWAHDRAALWNAAEARDTRVNSVTAREWEVALPHELDASGRRALAEGFARELVGRYGVAADVAIHAPHREGDQRNWHAHVLTTTRALGPEGLTNKTRVLDAKGTGGAEVEAMRARWAELQNRALERVGVEERVDHRTLAVQREEARAFGHEARADNLDRAPEAKLGPVVSGIERREERAAEREGRAYAPVTERGAQVHEARQARSLLAELAQLRESLRERVELARETYQVAREEGTDRIKAGLAALRAAAQRQGIGQGQEREAGPASIEERLGRILGREAPHHAQDGPAAGLSAAPQDRERGLGAEAIRERLADVLGRARPVPQDGDPAVGLPALGQDRERTQEAHQEHGLDPIRERLAAVLDRTRPVGPEREEIHDQRHEGRTHEDERDRAAERHRDRGIGHGL